MLIEIIPKVDLCVIDETLSRLGIADKKRKILYPTCVLYKDIDSKYYLCHFKEMFGFRTVKPSYDNMTEDDYVRRNSIALLLEEWGMIDIINLPEDDDIETLYIYILPYKEKKYWTIKNKFNMRTLYD